MRVHLNGMGLVGSLLALELQRRGVGFSWWDADEDVTAWRASTGCVYPSAEAVDLVGYNRWAKVLAEGSEPVCRFAEVVPYAFTQKSIPHGAGSKALRVIERHGSVKVLNKPSFHVNVQAFVEYTRAALASLRARPEPGGLLVHAHGFHRRMTTDYRWGWSAPCVVSGSVFDRHPRLCLNAKEGRFVNAYLYPRPGTSQYYVGTSFIYQREPRPLLVDEKVDRIIAHIKRVTGGGLGIELAGSVTAGWRPAYSAAGSAAFIRDGNEVFIRPQSANGLRHAPVWLERVASEVERAASQL